MTLDIKERLAFALSGSSGTYALLIGSGISSAAGIPTGWHIVRDLISKIALLKNPEAPIPACPATWYRDHFDKEPDYSDLLEMLAGTGAERQRLINDYIEPNEKEQSDGLKQPTAAHRAIAKLAKLGIIRVIITTNFDRLLENALTTEGVPLAVISSDSDVTGMMPLTQSYGQCQIIKLHGDYKDIRSLNTTSELKEYPESIDRLLDQVFDEFGVIICGWSANWDAALRKAVQQCKSQRFTWYWTHRGRVGEAAKQLIECRSAHHIPIEDADGFFTALQNQVEALLDSQRPHPDSTALAVALLKRYLTRPEDRIQLGDLIRGVAEQAAVALQDARTLAPGDSSAQASTSEKSRVPGSGVRVRRCSQKLTTASSLWNHNNPTKENDGGQTQHGSFGIITQARYGRRRGLSAGSPAGPGGRHHGR